METYRLKNIAIIILCILNLFLLFILLNFCWQSDQAHRNMVQQLHELFDANDVILDDDLDLDIQPLPTLAVQRNLETEAAIAATLLGEAVEAVHQGGGIYEYTGTTGSVHFRSNGNFDYTSLEGREIGDPEDFCRAFCEDYGYQTDLGSASGMESAVSDGTLQDTGLIYSSVKIVEEEVCNCTVEFHFLENKLMRVSGTYVSTENSAPAQTQSLSAVDALISFLDYRNQGGLICNTIYSIEPVYELQSVSGVSMQLTAKWRLTTDTYQYYVDCTSGGVVRA